MKTEGMTMYTIFRRPPDVPDAEFVVRAFKITSGNVVPQAGIHTASTLPGARLLVPEEATLCIPRSADDYDIVVESWL